MFEKAIARSARLRPAAGGHRFENAEDVLFLLAEHPCFDEGIPRSQKSEAIQASEHDVADEPTRDAVR
ncbi:hypothetical protein GCM10011390_43970 [Aureimonas endophytica]|uniref:Uncharacterized protein n=1 Tax=Aureimonas endophytica TaxID=2027858 RepID=A0A917A0K9_9HYPH|nr:hypothetical protein GCM10011390_43970 [Aureimonas endophytica]